MKINKVEISPGGQANFADKIDKIIYKKSFDISESDFERFKKAIKQLPEERFTELKNCYYETKNSQSDEIKNGNMEKLKKAIINNGIPVAQGLSASAIFESIKYFFI